MLESASLLEELWYERKDIQLSDVSVGYLGTGLRAQQTNERTRQPLTLPHLVQMWNDYVEMLSIDPYYKCFEKIVVFIDEVDKIRDVADIGRFLLILKALYGPMKLFFVVSISDDAYESFRKRGLLSGGRNEFDSSFDLAVRVEAMSHEEIRNLLNSRIIGPNVPRNVSMLIWMLSKGNPRDVIRLAREIVNNFGMPNKENTNGNAAVHQVGMELCMECLREVVSAYREVAERIAGRERAEAIGRILRLDEVGKDIEKIREAVEGAILEVDGFVFHKGEVSSNDKSSELFLAELWYVRTFIRFVFFDTRG